MVTYDVIVIGAGAAGLMFAGQLCSNLSCLIIESNKSPGRKIQISGGGRCNFTNLDVSPSHFLSKNEHFSKSALSRYTQWDFIDLVANKNIAYYEKKLGQLFCKKNAKDIINLLMDRLNDNTKVNFSEKVIDVDKEGNTYILKTSKGEYRSKKLVVASGGLSIPTIGASDIGFYIAKKFGHKLVETSPALVPLTMNGEQLEFCKNLSGVSLPVRLSVNNYSVDEDLLFTHKGISGPATLKGSLYWFHGDKIVLDFFPDYSFKDLIRLAKNKTLKNFLSTLLPSRLAESLASSFQREKLAEFSKKDLVKLEKVLKGFELYPSGTEGYRKAEVTRGGVSTDKISSKTFESQNEKGLYFIGEVLDVTGLLGGYNFQWAWSSAVAASLSISQ